MASICLGLNELRKTWVESESQYKHIYIKEMQ